MYILSDTHGPKIPHAVLLFFLLSHVYHLHECGVLSFTFWLQGTLSCLFLSYLFILYLACYGVGHKGIRSRRKGGVGQRVISNGKKYSWWSVCVFSCLFFFFCLASPIFSARAGLRREDTFFFLPPYASPPFWRTVRKTGGPYKVCYMLCVYKEILRYHSPREKKWWKKKYETNVEEKKVNSTPPCLRCPSTVSPGLTK